MKGFRFLFFFMLAVVAHPAMAQTAGSVNSSNLLLYALLGVAVLIFFGVLLKVSDNLLAIEANRSGISTESHNVGIWPRVSELFASKAPAFVAKDHVVRLTKGYDMNLEGAAVPKIDHEVRGTHFAVVPGEFRGIAPIPKLDVTEGQHVKAGDSLFHNKSTPGIKYVAPVSGEVVAINRGEKRSIASIVIRKDAEIAYKALPVISVNQATREELVAFLAENGAWPLINQRPFNTIADLDEVPRDIFISTFDSAPLAPDMGLAVGGNETAFAAGLAVLGKLTSGKVHLGLDARTDEAPSAVFANASGVEKHWFSGKHPVGNVGVQIHHIRPITSDKKVWTLGVQDVITIGYMVTNQHYDASRLVALTGAELNAPRYVYTYMGAQISELIAGEVKSDKKVRIISGDVLSGKTKTPDGYLGFHDDQITVLEEGDDYEMFGWLIPSYARPSLSPTFPNNLFPGVPVKANTSMHGEKRAFVVTGQYEDVLPMDIMPQQLMKAILNSDVETMEKLGILELSEEDIALCEFACTSKQPLQQMLRNGLDMMMEQA